MRDAVPLGYPRTIENGAGERLTWLGMRLDDDGREYLDMKGELEPGAGPPLHIHQLQTETITVDGGRIGYVTGSGPQQFAGPGATMTFKPGEVHRFWNAGDSVATVHGWASPPLNFEYLLTQTFASTKRNGGTRPNAVEAAYLLGRYRSEFAIAGIPKPVQTLVFPLMRLVGKINGVSKRYTDAPPPVAAG